MPSVKHRGLIHIARDTTVYFGAGQIAECPYWALVMTLARSGRPFSVADQARTPPQECLGVRSAGGLVLLWLWIRGARLISVGRGKSGFQLIV